MESIVAQFQSLADKADEAGRNSLLLTLQKLQVDLESPKDTFLRLYNSNLQLAIIYVGNELDLFTKLTQESDRPLTLTELAQTCGASPDLLERILRYLSSVGLIANVAPNQYQAVKLTHLLGSPLANAGIRHGFDNCGPAVQAFPLFLAESNYQDVTDNSQTAFQKGFNTNLTCFEWLKQHPRNFDAMHKVMTGLGSNDWIRDFPLVDDSVRKISLRKPELSERPFFVDVGGGHGHQCSQLLERYPSLSGHIILQDLSEAVSEIKSINGVKIMAQDFFEKQAIQGAKFYYLRRILHDWPDELSVKILQNLKAAMSKESRILIDEIVLPDMNAHWQAAMADMTMGILFGGKERSKKHWEDLVASSGLRIVEIHTYNISQSNSIIVLELP